MPRSVQSGYRGSERTSSRRFPRCAHASPGGPRRSRSTRERSAQELIFDSVADRAPGTWSSRRRPGASSHAICSTIATRSTGVTFADALGASVSTPSLPRCTRPRRTPASNASSDTTPSMPGPAHHPGRAAPSSGPVGIRRLGHQERVASNTRVADAGTGTATSDRSDPVASRVERPTSRVRASRLTTTRFAPLQPEPNPAFTLDVRQGHPSAAHPRVINSTSSRSCRYPRLTAGSEREDANAR